MQKKYFALILAIIMLISCFTGCANNNDDTVVTTQTTTAKEKDNSSFKLSFTQADSLDPFKATTQNNQVLASLVFESLFDLDENYEPIANIATGYAFIDSKTLKVDINQQIRFSDGSELDLEDVIFSINAAKKSAAYGSSLDSIGNVEADGNSVIIKLNYANPNAVNLLTFPITSIKDDEDGFPVGNGRYKYQNNNGKITLVVNGEDFDPYINTITLVNIASSDSIDNAVNIGNISYAFRDMSVDASKRMSCSKKAVDMNNLVYIGVNSKYGITSSNQIRQAISLAVNRNTLVESAYSGYAQPALSVFNPNFKMTENISIFSENEDLSAARQAINQSGYESDKLTLSILVDKNENKNAAANLIKTQLESVGFSVKVESVNYKEYVRRIGKAEFDLYIGEVKLASDMCLYPFLDSKGGVSYGIDHKKLNCDNLYIRYLNGSVELEKFILSFYNEMPYIPLLYKKGMICYSKAMNGDMQGYYNNFFSNIDSWNFNS